MPQLESITAYENLDEILKVDGIEAFAGGPNDLAQSMGFPGQPDHPDCLTWIFAKNCLSDYMRIEGRRLPQPACGADSQGEGL